MTARKMPSNTIEFSIARETESVKVGLLFKASGDGVWHIHREFERMARMQAKLVLATDGQTVAIAMVVADNDIWDQLCMRIC